MSSRPGAFQITVKLMALGFLAGAVCGLLAFIPMLFVLERGPGPTTVGGILVVPASLSVVGGILGTLLGPILGWVNIRRASIRTIVLETSAGTMLGAVVFFVFLRAYGWPPVDPLIIGGIIGAMLATLRLRLSFPRKSPGRSRSDRTPSRNIQPENAERSS